MARMAARLTGTRTALDEIADERDHHIEVLIRMERHLADGAASRGQKHIARVHWRNLAHYIGCRRPEVVRAIEIDKGIA